MKLVMIGVYCIVFCVALLIIFSIRKTTDGINSDTNERQDIFDRLKTWRIKHLAIQPWNMTYETYTMIANTCSIIFFIGLYLYKGIIQAIIGAIAGQFIPEIVVLIQSNSQKAKFEERYVRSLRTLAASLRSGMSLIQAVNEVCNTPGIHESIKKEYQHLNADLKLGIAIPDAFMRFAERIQSKDAYDVANAIAMQSKVGGREGDCIETISQNISDRMMLRKEVNSMFAGSKMTVYVMDVIPFGAAIMMLFAGKEFTSCYFESTKMLLVLIGLLAFMGVGSIVSHRMIMNLRKECGI